MTEFGARLRHDGVYAAEVLRAVLEATEAGPIAKRFGVSDAVVFVAEIGELLDERIPADRSWWREQEQLRISTLTQVARQCAEDPRAGAAQLRRSFRVIDRGETLLRRVESTGRTSLGDVGAGPGACAQPVMDREYRAGILAAMIETNGLDLSTEFDRQLVAYLSSDEDGEPDPSDYFPPDPNEPVLISHVLKGRIRILLDLAKQRQREAQLRGRLNPHRVDLAVLDAILDSISIELTILGFAD